MRKKLRRNSQNIILSKVENITKGSIEMTFSSHSSTIALVKASTALRAALSDDGILIKDQINYCNDNVSLASCVSCTSLASMDTVTTSCRFIPYPDILSASYIGEEGEEGDREPQEVEVVFARKKQRTLVPTSLVLQIDDLGLEDVVAEIYRQSYKGSHPRKSILVLVNPHGGKGKATKVFMKKANPILNAAQAKVEIMETKYSKHAIDIARELDLAKYDIIACASGDGVPYEVFNGFYQRLDRAQAFNKVAITQVPCGSGNAMSESCHGTGDASFAALSLVKSHVVNVDLMAVTQGDRTSVSFLSQTVGVIADSDIGTEHLRFLGPARFELGVVYKVLTRTKYPCEIAIKYAAKSKNDVRSHFDNYNSQNQDQEREITEENFQLKYDLKEPVPSDWDIVDKDFANNLGIFYTGKMPYISKDVQFFPAALPNDGTIDLVMLDARTSITRQTPILLSLDSGKHINAPEVHHSKVLAYRLKPKYSEGMLSVDGERYPFEELQVEVLPGAAKTLLKGGVFVETNF